VALNVVDRLTAAMRARRLTLSVAFENVHELGGMLQSVSARFAWKKSENEPTQESAITTRKRLAPNDE
jgi:hypothetical protein